MVPGRRPQSRLEPLALPLPSRSLPVRGTGAGERHEGATGPRVRTGRHGGLRRRPVLGRRGPLCQGGPARPPHEHRSDQRRQHGGALARPTHRMVPEHVVVGSRPARAAARADGTGDRRAGPPLPRQTRSRNRRSRVGPVACSVLGCSFAVLLIIDLLVVRPLRNGPSPLRGRGGDGFSLAERAASETADRRTTLQF